MKMTPRIYFGPYTVLDSDGSDSAGCFGSMTVQEFPTTIIMNESIHNKTILLKLGIFTNPTLRDNISGVKLQ